MNKLISVEKFIELRALGYTFDEIVSEIKVSKPTLIKWGKEYKNQIQLTERKLAEKLSETIAKNNSNFLDALFKFYYQQSKNQDENKKVNQRIYRRASKKLFKLFKNEMKSLELSFNSEGQINSAKIYWDEEEGTKG